MKKYYTLLFALFIGIIFSKAQTYQWAKSIGGTSSDICRSIVVDGSGNVHIIGTFIGTVDFDPGVGTSNLTSAGGGDIFISKLDATGNFIWAKSMGGTSTDQGYSIAVDGSGNVYTTGYFVDTVDFDPGGGTNNLTSVGNQDIFISKLDAAGNFIWAKSMGGALDDSGISIAVDSFGNTYTTGYFFNTVDFNPGTGTNNLTSVGNQDIFISKLDAAGNFIWAKNMGGTSRDISYSIAVDVTGNVYTTGYFLGTADFDPGAGTSNLVAAGSFDIFISKLDTAGNFSWAKRMGGTAQDFSYSIAVDDTGNIYTTGKFYGTVDFDPGVGISNLTAAGGDEIFVSKLDTAGNFSWAKRMGGTAADEGRSITSDSYGNVYITGMFQDTADFDPGTATTNLTSAAEYDIFILKLDAAGNFSWAKSMGGSLRDRSNSIALDVSGNVYTTGWFYRTVDFNPGAGTNNFTSSGNSDIFISKLGPVSVGILKNSFENTLKVYPNPAKGAVNIELGSSYDEVTVIVRNPIGKEVFQKSYHNSNYLQVNIPGKAALYFIEVRFGDRREVIKAIKE